MREAAQQSAGSPPALAMAGYAASLAHEISQPLATILTHADAALRWIDRPHPDLGEAVSGLEQIRASARRAAGIVASLRALARQAPPALVPVRIEDVVADALQLVAGEADARRIAIVDRLAAARGAVLVDPVQIRQVLINLVTNAIHAIGERASPDGRVTIETSPLDGAIRIAVSDNGCGMEADVLARIFEPFFTTKSCGMGVGLAICRSIIEAHGARLEASSARGEGSTFSFALLRAPEA